ncbi:MAG: hypothetical protein JXB38_01120 [Anaerolineales bacterium]|nr:hypothetical protein [Anaerolineales bacterium]
MQEVNDASFSVFDDDEDITQANFIILGLAEPILISPADSAAIDQMHPVLTWGIPAWTPENYNIVLEPLGGGTPLVDQWVSAAAVCTTECTWTVNQLLPDGDYQWRLRGYTAGVGASEFSPTWTFTIDSAVDLVAPDAGESVDFLKPTFTWVKPSWFPVAYNVVVEPLGGGTALINAWLNGGTVCGASECTWTTRSYLQDGAYQWRVQAYTSGYGASSWLQARPLTVAATPVLISPPDGAIIDYPRPELVWTQRSWIDWYQVEITPDGEAPQSRWVNASVCSTGDCTWTVNFTMADGDYDWRVRGYTAVVATSYWSTSAAMTVQAAPQLNSPANGGTVDDPKPDLSWDALSWAEWYLLEVYDSGLGLTSRWLDAATVCSTGVCNFSTAFTLAADDYTWRVMGYTAGMPVSPWSATWSMEVVTPTLISPTDGATVDTGRPSFSWDELSWADWYELVIEPQGGGTPILSAWLDDVPLCSGGTCSWPVYITLSDGAYQWKVRGYTAAYAVGPYATPNAMTVQQSPQLLTPADGATVTVNRPTLSWEAMSWVTHYEVQIIPQGGGTNVDRWVDATAICAGGVCTWQVDMNLANDAYTWQLRGYNGSASPTTSPWSEVWDLTVDIP